MIESADAAPGSAAVPAAAGGTPAIPDSAPEAPLAMIESGEAAPVNAAVPAAAGGTPAIPDGAFVLRRRRVMRAAHGTNRKRGRFIIDLDHCRTRSLRARVERPND